MNGRVEVATLVLAIVSGEASLHLLCQGWELVCECGVSPVVPDDVRHNRF